MTSHRPQALDVPPSTAPSPGPRIFIETLTDGYAACIRRALEFLGGSARIGANDTVCIKPNLTFPTFRKGVMTNPDALEAAIVHLKNFTDRIVVCESDSGGYNRFSMDAVFEATGLAALAKRYGVRVVNMSNAPSREIHFRYGWRHFFVPLPTLLLDETDLFVTMPVPKVHLNTVVSVALKNQWGVIQEPALRLKLHPYFKEVIYQVNAALPRSIAIVDGKYGLTRSGPLRGDVIELNWMLAGNDLYYTDYVVTQLMGFDPRKIPYLAHIFRKRGIDSVDAVEFSCDWRSFRSEAFYLAREWTDYPGVLTFNSRTLAYIGYESVLAKPLHWLLYRFREPFY